MNRILSTLLAITVFTACQHAEESENPPEPVVIDEAAVQRIDSTLQSFISDSIVAGASALIFEKGKEVYFNAYGYADKEAGVPMDRNTIATIYSMTKPITGTALMTLYEEGKFRLDDPLSMYLPEYKDMQVATLDGNGELTLVPANREITIADITRHTAGFSTRSDLGLDTIQQAANLLDFNSDLATMSDKLSKIPLGYQPGKRWEYGISVDVQAYLVEKLAEKPFSEYMREVVLDPLGMTETRYFVPEDDRNRVAAIYYKTDTSLTKIADEIHANNFNEVSLTPGGWGLTSTIDDYMKFAQMLVQDGTYNNVTVLKPETVKLMATNHLPPLEDSLWLPSKGRVGFGIDFAVRTAPAQSPDENVGTVGEFFWDGAASTLFWVDPQNDLTVVLFVQVMPFQGIVHKKFRDAVYGPM
ncbi:MAG: serine hydrolase [Cyclobacteriaceae bacterium]